MWDARRPLSAGRGASVAFGPPRTVGLFGFVETGWEPVPYAVLSPVAEAVAVLAAGVWAVRATRGWQITFVTFVTRVPRLWLPSRRNRRSWRLPSGRARRVADGAPPELVGAWC